MYKCKCHEHARLSSLKSKTFSLVLCFNQQGLMTDVKVKLDVVVKENER